MGYLPKKKGNVSIDVTLRRVPATMVIVDKQYVLSIQILRYPACKAHAPYYIVVCGLSGYAIFLHIISKRDHFFKFIEHKMNVF